MKEPGLEVAIAGMDEYERMELGRKTLEFVRRIRRNNPEAWEKIQKIARQMEKEER